MALPEWVVFAIELIKALAWPVAVSVISWRLGPTFIDAIKGRPVNVEAFGVRASIAAVEQQKTSPDTPADASALEPARAPSAVIRETLQLVEREIRTALTKYAPTDREPALINALAVARVGAQHEATYNRIFGSQIAGLKLLDERGSATIAEARTFFEPYARQNPQVYATYGFGGWLSFMLNARLVERVGDRLTVTPYGHDFLIYLREARLTEAKAG